MDKFEEWWTEEREKAGKEYVMLGKRGKNKDSLKVSRKVKNP